MRLSALRASVRTLEGVLALTPLAGERFRPLSHLSVCSILTQIRPPREGWIRRFAPHRFAAHFVRLSALRASVRTLEGVLALTPLAGERVDSRLRLSPFGRSRCAQASKIALGDFVDHSAISPMCSCGSGHEDITILALKVSRSRPKAHFLRPPTDWAAHVTVRGD